jgi:hypothetical protein
VPRTAVLEGEWPYPLTHSRISPELVARLAVDLEAASCRWAHGLPERVGSAMVVSEGGTLSMCSPMGRLYPPPWVGRG